MAINAMLVRGRPEPEKGTVAAAKELMPPIPATESLKTNCLPKRPVKGRYIKELQQHDVEWVENNPPEVPNAQELGEAAGKALALANVEFSEANVRRLTAGETYHNPKTNHRQHHVYWVVTQGAKNGGKVEEYGTVPKDFQEWHDAVIKAAREAYDPLVTEEAKDARWVEHILATHDEMARYVHYVAARLKAEILAELLEQVEATEAGEEEDPKE